MNKYVPVILLCIVAVKVAAQPGDTTGIFYTTATGPSTLDNRPIYNVRPLLDGGIAAATTAWTLYGFSIIYKRDTVPYGELNALSRENVNRFDKGTTNNYDKSAKAASDKFFYGSMPLPLILLIDKRIRHDAAKVGLMYLETIAATGTIYTIAAMSANRFRPYAYNKSLSLKTRSYGGARNSFFAGHVAIVGASTFFMASVYSAYHPERKNKWILYGIAGAATATTGYLRIKAGQHFPTDVLVGAIVGPTVGMLIPHFHKNRQVNSRLVFSPRFSGDDGGVSVFYQL